jgi:HEAT repeat protein
MAAIVLAAAIGYLAASKSPPAAEQANDVRVQTLQSQCEAMAEELSRLAAELDAEKDRSAKLTALTEQIQTLQNAPAKDAAGQDQKPADPMQTDAAIGRLQDENKRLRAELDSVKALLAKQTASAGAALKTDKELPPVEFRNAQLLAAWQEVAASTSKVRTLELLNSLNDYAAQQDLELIPILQQAMLSGDADVCRQAMQMLAGYQSPAVLPALEQAFATPDEFTRLAALAPIENINDPQVVNLLNMAFNDAAEDVRSRAVEIVRDQPEPLQLVSLQQAILSPHTDVGGEAISLLQLRGDKPAVSALIAGLNHPDPEFRSEVSAALEFLVSQEFTTADQAADWWNANQDRFDDNLFEK